MVRLSVILFIKHCVHMANIHNLRRICVVHNLEVVLWKVLSLIVLLHGEGHTSIVQFYQIGSFH